MGRLTLLLGVIAVGCGSSSNQTKTHDQGADSDGSTSDHDGSTAKPDLSLADLSLADLTDSTLSGDSAVAGDAASDGTLTCSAYRTCVAACTTDPCSAACYDNTTAHAKTLLQAIADCEYADCFTGANPQCMPSEHTAPATTMCAACEKFARMFGMGKCPTQFQDCTNDI
jgi:hypothetical protein